jgi:hypothetical protein
LWNWCWGIKTVDDCLGIVTYDIRDELAKEQADLFARNLRTLAVRGKLQDHVGGGVTVTRIGIQVATPFLDEVVTIIETAYDPSFTGLASAVPLVGGIAKGLSKADNLDDIVRAAKGTPGPTPMRKIPDGKLVAQTQSKLRLYPKVVDPRTGRNINFPSSVIGPVEKSLRVDWDSKTDRAAFIAEWYRRGFVTPKGGWERYDIHHIHPREFGGTNDFWNLVPVERGTHQELFNEFWQDFRGL